MKLNFSYSSRLARLRMAMRSKKLPALLVTKPCNLRYLCGFTGSTGALLATQKRLLLFIDGRYTAQVEQEAQGIDELVTQPAPLLGAWLALKKMHLQRAGLEGAYLSHEAWRALAFKAGQGLSLVNASVILEELRLRKDEAEIGCIRKAGALGDELFKVALRHIRPGAKEVKVAAEIEYAARQKGAEGMAFATIVAGGIRSALPHGVASQNRLPAKGFVVLDFGVILSGYCSDMTRTVHIGRLDARARSMYEAVRESQEAARQGVRSGIPAGAMDRRARTMLQKRGYGQYFSHSTGHGVGMEVHEAPRLGKGNKERLQAGMVLTIEPGVYIPGYGGVRIEDMVLVTQSGCETLTSSTRELITV